MAIKPAGRELGWDPPPPLALALEMPVLPTTPTAGRRLEEPRGLVLWCVG